MKFDVIIGNDHADICTTTVGAVTRLKTGTCIKRPVRYLDDVDEVDEMSDDHTDKNVDNMPDDHADNRVDNVPDDRSDNNDDIIDDSNHDVIADDDVRVGLEPVMMPSANLTLIDD
jgi:hypothetical protein